jgi:WD40-like Beta Propeller Repeat
MNFNGRFSPDGKWIAYQSNESGRPEIYLTPFPGPSDKRRVSSTGGSDARWRGDGSEIFYLAPGNKMTAVDVSVRGPTAEVGAMLPLFDVRKVVGLEGYDVTADGQRFLVNTRAEQKGPPTPITLVINWTEDLKR